ncbi:MAG: ABC transporter ATP-binding protein [Robiginitomaculum sp.]|nr:MAG: ABC transporter ATP-binding protein [Robiginitomaculum sp.]
MNHSVLHLENVSKSFGSKLAVSNLDLNVRAGSITGFLGPNGAGKSTSIRMGLGILPADSGKVHLFGQKPNYRALDRVGFLPEERGLYRKMKVLAVIVYFARLKGMKAAAARTNAMTLLTQFDLADVAHKKVRELSKGMAQKVQIICAIVHKPEFVILDEPFSGLDPVNQQTLEGLIRDLAKAGTTILFSTHVMEHAERLCDRIVLLSQGRKIFDGNVSQALDTINERVILETAKDCDPNAVIGQLASQVHAIEPTGPDSIRWSVELATGCNSQQVLRACVEAKLPLRAIEPKRRHLHDVFVHLVEQDQQANNRAAS